MFILVTGQIKIIFPQDTEAPRRLRSHQFSVGQAPDRAGGLLGCLGGPAGFVCVCGRRKVRCLPHTFCKLFDLNWLKRSRKSGEQDETVLAGQLSFLFQ